MPLILLKSAKYNEVIWSGVIDFIPRVGDKISLTAIDLNTLINLLASPLLPQKLKQVLKKDTNITLEQMKLNIAKTFGNTVSSIEINLCCDFKPIVTVYIS